MGAARVRTLRGSQDVNGGVEEGFWGREGDVPL